MKIYGHKELVDTVIYVNNLASASLGGRKKMQHAYERETCEMNIDLHLHSTCKEQVHRRAKQHFCILSAHTRTSAHL